MKKKFFMMMILSMILIFSNKTIAQADGNTSDPCAEIRYAKEKNSPITFSSQKDPGFEVASMSFDPPYPVVVGQDETRDGVTIKIILKSHEGTITNLYKFRRYPEVYSGCIYTEYGKDMVECYSGIHNKKYKKDLGPDYNNPICTPAQPGDPDYYINVYRRIDASTVRVWLDPEQKTKQWLGWIGGESGKNLLRYVYPDSWALTKFTSTGPQKQCEGKACNLNQYQYDYLKADPRINVIPSRTLQHVSSQVVEEGIDFDVLALYGQFSTYLTWSFGLRVSDPYACMIDKDSVTAVLNGFSISEDDPYFHHPDMKGSCTTSDSNADIPNPTKSFNYSNLSEKYTDITLTLNKVPIDLPGKWQVGIYFHTDVATDSNGLEWEDMANKYATLYLDPDQYYNMTSDQHTFSVYLMMTTPCNDQEQNGCTQ